MSLLDRRVIQSKKRPFKIVSIVAPQNDENGNLTKSFKKGPFGRLILVGSDEEKPSINAVKVSPLVKFTYRYLFD